MTRIQRCLALTLTSVMLLALVDCASIIHGSRQEVSFGSTPSDASLTIDDQQVGNTPYVAKLPRKNKHIVKIELAGYQPYELAMSRGTSGWVWGNIVFGGLIGLIVDASTGAMYKIKPAEVQAALVQQGARVDRQADMMIVMVTLTPDPEWERIGAMMPQ